MIDDPEDTATVTDSPAANRRESRATGTHRTPSGNIQFSDPLVNRRTLRTTTTPLEFQSLASASWIDPHIAGSAIETRSATSIDGAPEAIEAERQRAQRQQLNKLALFTEDVALMRTFSQLVGILCLTLVVVLPFLDGNPILRTVLWGGSLFSIFTSIWVVFALRDLTRYDQNLINVMALLSVLIAYAGVLYLGVHSPAPLLILSGLYFVARSQSKAIALSMYLVCALLQGTISGLILSDTIVDPGLMRATDADMKVRYIIQLLIQMSYLGTFILARTGRAGTLLAMDKVTAAEQKAQQREAAFIEVREDLDRALAAGGLGHYSGHQLGNYKLGGIIGRGAMGEVYDAIHVQTGQLTAAKVLHPHVLAKKSSIQRFLREAEAAGSLRSPHSVQILDASDASAPIPYLIMERLNGFDLAHHLREVGKLSISDVVTLCEQIGKVIDLAAATGIVHRDLKPQNLFLAESSTGSIWKLLDFGASKLAEHSGTLTQGRVIGTPAYMSPQQAKGQDVDGAADRYCLAAIAYRSLTGRAPYSGKDLPTTLFNVVYGTPPRPSILAPLDPSIDMVLAIGMAKKPKMRFATGVEFARALESAAAGRMSPDYQERGEAVLAKHPWGMQPDQD
ncbi:MAG: serine/threonine protein kinase [Kofleriaceae bacterium]|nr:serine/threonine protein kinase [Kofleriaceae bacterium]